MSYELHPSPIGTIVRALAESTYGTDPTISDTDTIYVEELSGSSWVQDPLPRRGVAAYRPGFKSAAGPARGNLSMTCELAHVDLANASARPMIHPLLCAAAFTVAGSNADDYSGPGYTANGGSNDIIVTYSSRGVTQPSDGSARIEVTQIEQGGSRANRHTFAGYVCDFNISYSSGERLLISFDGASKPTRPANVSSPTEDSPYLDEPPAVGAGATVMIQRLSDDSVWGGGTAAAPNTAGGGILSMEIAGNSTVNERQGINGTGGVIGQFVSATDPHSVTLVVEEFSVADWDWFDLQADSDPIYVRAVFPSASDANLLVETAFHMMVDSVEVGDDSGRKVLTISGDTIWAEDSADGGGLQPGSHLDLKYIKLVDAP